MLASKDSYLLLPEDYRIEQTQRLDSAAIFPLLHQIRILGYALSAYLSMAQVLSKVFQSLVRSGEGGFLPSPLPSPLLSLLL